MACNTIYPAKALVIMKSKYDDHFWLIRSDGFVKKMSAHEMVEEFASCVNYPGVTYCQDRGMVIVWSKRGLSGIGFTNAVVDEDLWCNLKRLARLVSDRLTEPVSEDDVEEARKELSWSLTKLYPETVETVST